jgi:hypothetical protein
LTARRPGARAAAFPLAVALFAACLAAAPAGVRPVAAQAPSWTTLDSAVFEIYQDDEVLGTEEYRAYRSHDTLIVGSALKLTGLREGSTLSPIKTTTFLRRADNSWPLAFQVNESGRDTTKEKKSVSCDFSDTTVVVYHEKDGVGRGTVVALPPGRIYLLEPGIYAQVQTLVGDFVRSSQNKRKQPVLIPSAKQVVDIHLTRGARERLGQDGYVVETTRVDLTDKFVQLVAWVDKEGRMWKLEAPRQGLRVERAVPAGPPAAAPGDRTKSGK